MEYFTQQDFMTHTKGVIYFLMIGILVCYVCFWLYLSAKDNDDQPGGPAGHHH